MTSGPRKRPLLFMLRKKLEACQTDSSAGEKGGIRRPISIGVPAYRRTRKLQTKRLALVLHETDAKRDVSPARQLACSVNIGYSYLHSTH
jgi:hypothetical protein